VFRDLAEQLVGLSRLFKQGDARIFVRVNTELLADLFEQLQYLRVFLLGEQIDLQVEAAAALVDSGLAIFRDKDESGEKYRLQRNNQCEKVKWKRIERLEGATVVSDNPKTKPDDMHPDKPHRSAKPGNQIGDTIGS